MKGVLMFEEEVRIQMVRILTTARDQLISQINKIEADVKDINGNKDGFEKSCAGFGSEADELLFALRGSKESLASKLERVVIRLQDLEKFRYDGTCPQCLRPIPEKDLLEVPTMVLCGNCELAKRFFQEVSKQPLYQPLHSQR